MMNSSLNPNRFRLLALIAMLFLNIQLNAQSKSQISYGLSLNGGGGWAITNGTDYNTYCDTVLSSNSTHFNKGIHIWLNYSLGKKSDLQLGLGYQQTGFSRKQEDLQFKNYTYPGIGTGRIEDLSNTPKGFVYNYHFNYLQIPVFINTYLARSSDYKWVFHFSGGLTPQILLKHQLRVDCIPGYSVNGEDKFVFDSSGFEAKSLAISAQMGMNIEYKATKNKTYFFQPMIGIYPVSVTKAGNPAIPYFVSLNVGVLFSSLKNED